LDVVLAAGRAKIIYYEQCVLDDKCLPFQRVVRGKPTARQPAGVHLGPVMLLRQRGQFSLSSTCMSDQMDARIATAKDGPPEGAIHWHGHGVSGNIQQA
jgi:hypothetical protein